MKFIRILRGAMGTAVLWIFPWAALGAVYGVIMWTYSRFALPWLHIPLAILPYQLEFFGGWGFVSGTLFAATIVVAERRRGKIRELSLRRSALWGALSGTVVPAVVSVTGVPLVPALILCGFSALVGAVLAAGTLKLAQRPSAVLIPGPSTTSLQTLD